MKARHPRPFQTGRIPGQLDPDANQSVIAHLVAKYGTPQDIPGRILTNAHHKHLRGETVTRQDLDTWAAEKPEGVVYYLTFNGLIKIGTSTNVKGRMASLPHDELLATEPGSYELEKQRHRQFAHLRYKNEWFNPGPELQAHIRQLKEATG
jgi:hypothetical protein